MGLLELLQGTQGVRPTGIPAIAAWRVHLVETQTVEVAMRQMRFGGPYTPPSLKHTAEAQIFVQWADGLCTQSTLTRGQLARGAESLVALYSQAYMEPYPDIVPGPASLADIRVCIPEVRDAILHDPSVLVAPIRVMQEALRPLGTDQVRGSLTAQYAHITFASSEGAHASHEATRVSYGVDVGSRSWFQHDLRAVPDEAEMLPRLARVRQDYEQMCHPYEGTLKSPQVVLAPSVANQFFQYFLLQNLSMQAILNGGSAFTRADLENQAQLFHPDFTIEDIPVRDDHATAFRLDDRGQSPKARELIAGGRLVGADVSLRAAAQGQIPPTPTSLTGNWLLAHGDTTHEDAGDIDLAACLAGIQNGVYIYSVLGLHTQDATRGAYSLGIPRALVVKDGRIKGFVRGTMVGNFFEDLRVPLCPVRDPLADKPILPVLGHFTQAE